MAGRRLGPYRIGRLIGKGGKASVYRAIDTRSQTQVALKLLDLPARYAGADWQGARDRFLHEAKAAGHLRHPNIVQILDSGVQDGMAYIAMEYLGGQDLGAWCRPGHLLPLTLTLSIAARIGQALAFAHRQQVVHRDVKPANILYDRDSDTLKVTDFGIAHLGGSRSPASDAARTPGYMSPEQCAGTAVDLRSDLYSLGVTLYQMLTGVLPLVGESLAELERRIATEDAPDIRALNPNLPQPLAELVARLLDKQPDRRYQDGDDVAQDLYRLAAELGQQAAQDPFSDSGFGFAPTQIQAPDGAAPTPVRGGSAGAGVRSGGKPGKSP
ncbi:MAG: serine/threonine protein kinase [Rhodoferax sp.]|nr:serine/threonine protein kinase [Rhodoferax sp.]